VTSEAQETTGDLTTNNATTIGARRNHLRFMFLDIEIILKIDLPIFPLLIIFQNSK
jgi:hypothetical protein